MWTPSRIRCINSVSVATTSYTTIVSERITSLKQFLFYHTVIPRVLATMKKKIRLKRRTKNKESSNSQERKRIDWSHAAEIGANLNSRCKSQQVNCLKSETVLFYYAAALRVLTAAKKKIRLKSRINSKCRLLVDCRQPCNHASSH